MSRRGRRARAPATRPVPGATGRARGSGSSADGGVGATARAALEARFRRIALVRESIGVLQWDMAAVMPSGGAAVRGEQMATLREIAHELLVAEEVGDWLARARAEAACDGSDAWQLANLREMERERRHAMALPGDLVVRHSRAVSSCEMDWRARRDGDDFPGVLPALREVLGLTREIAEAKAEALGVSPYDALLDEYEPGGSSAEIDRLFAELTTFLPGLTSAVIDKQRAEGEVPVLPGPFPAHAQHRLAERVMGDLGFDFSHGRLDTSHHPFCGGVPEDVRITTRWNESDFLRGLMAVVHETGHALYERGLPAAFRHRPVGLARGMSVHEGQSLLVEMQVCRSAEFLAWLAPLARQAFAAPPARKSGGVVQRVERDDFVDAWSADALRRRATRVARTLIRVEADEVTYPAHVILRYRLERAMIGGTLDPADLPGAWRDGMRELLGVEPPDDRTGCLQDIHWYAGSFGYFPTYTLGAMTAAQLFEAARRAEPCIPGEIARGEARTLMGWLRENVHSLGSMLPTSELIERATGRPLDPAVFRRHLETRYLSGEAD